jgi:hypothetical protein
MPTSNSRIEYIGGHLADPLGVMTGFLQWYGRWSPTDGGVSTRTARRWGEERPIRGDGAERGATPGRDTERWW